MAQQLNLLQGPEPVETAELHFKLHCKLRVFETNTKYEEGHCCILAVSQYYGLIFVGNLNGFSVITTKSLSLGTNSEEFPKRNISLYFRPTHLTVDSTQKILAVVCKSKSGSILLFYSIQSFALKAVKPSKVISVAKLIQNSTAEVVDLIWQPNKEGSFVMCMSDGSVLAMPQGIKDDSICVLPSSTQAMCLCWSPKGKQIVIGAATGTLSQYKPDLKLVKTLPSPPLYNGNVMVVSVLWISSFQFAVAYNDRANPESFPVITIVNAVKNEPLTVINYDDITYSGTLFRNHQIYMSHQAAWNLILVSSANSIEIAVLHLKGTSSWEQWLLGDASRAELPLNPDRQETFPLGWAFDYTSQEAIPWGEGSLPPMPRLLLVSDEGLLCVFNVVNAAADAPPLCSPPQESFDDSLFTVSAKTPPPATSEATSPVQAEKGILGSPPNFGSAKPTYNFLSNSGFGGFTTQAQGKTPLFGTAPAFSFSGGGGLNVAFAPKPATSEKPKSWGGPFALMPSPSQKSISSAKTLRQSTPVKEPEVPVQDKTTSPLPAAKKPEEVEAAGKTEEVVAKGESAGPGTPELAAVDDSVYLSALQEEVDHFNSELQQLSARVGNLDIQLGTEEDKARMKKSIDKLYSFWNELKETTEGQSNEIHAVVMNLMEAFAWLEDAKSRNLQRKNPSYIELKKSEELDPLIARHMEEISHFKYYIVNQLKQLTGHLEKEWMDHQENHRNEIKSKMTVPPLEEVYKTMHYQLKILHKQKTLLEELKGKIALRKRKNKSQSLLISSAANSTPSSNTTGNRASELSKLAENLLQLKINREEDFPGTGAWELVRSQLTAISDRSKKLTREKQTALRDALSERDMVKIRPVKTTFESSTFLRPLHLEKTTPKTPKSRPYVKGDDHAQKDTPPAGNANVPAPEPEPKPDPLLGKPDENPATAAKADASKDTSLKPSGIPLTVHSLPISEERSPLASLTGIVSSIGKKTDAATFVFRTPTFQKAEPSADALAFGPKSDQKQEEPKVSQPFTFGVSKPADSIFGKKEPTVFGAKPIFNLPNSISVATTKSDVTKGVTTANITITPVTTAPATTSLPFSFTAATTTTTTPPSTTSSFTFTAATTAAAASTGLPKVNLFAGKETTAATTESLFSAATPAATSAPTSLFGNSISIFGGANKTTATTTTTTTTTTITTTTTTFALSTASFEFPKPTTETPAQPSGFALVQTSENKSPASTNGAVQTPSSETEEIDVVGVDEPPKKPEPLSEKSRDSPKAAAAATTTTTPSPPAKSTLEVTTTASPNLSVSTSAVSTANAFSSPAAPAVTAPTETSSDVTTTTMSSSATAATTTVFSFSSVTTPVLFGQTATTATATTTISFFGTPSTTTTTSALFGQVSSTTPTTNILGGSTPTPPASSIFGNSTPVKTVPDQPPTPSTTSESIFGSSTPTMSTFGQVSTPLSAAGTPFGQKSDSIEQTSNLFGQLLSDGNKSVFGGSPTPATTANIFTSPKNMFELTTTAGLAFRPTFGTSVFEQPTTASSVFAAQTSTSNSFAQNMYSGFGKGSTATPTQTPFKSGGFSEPVFGQSVFGQSFKGATNTPAFGGSPSSIFGSTPSSTSTNVFQTPTTSTTFGSASPGPFSGGTSSFGESAFGSSSTLQKPLGGFASPPVFGGGPGGSAAAPAFGGSPTFGGSPSFGSLPTFGSVSQGGFGQSSGSTTFENLANQSTVGFGNLAQQTQAQGFGGGFGSSSFESKPAFGGNSFSSWRSK